MTPDSLFAETDDEFYRSADDVAPHPGQIKLYCLVDP